MYMPKPAPGHLRLEKLAGSWVGEETMYPSQWDPKGGTATGRNDHKLILGGFCLQVDYEQERDGAITFRGHGIYTYDPKEDLYTLHWFDGIGSPPELFTGTFEGDVLTLGHGGPGMHACMTYDFSTPDTMKGKMEMSPDGNDWKLLFEALYERV